MLPAAAAWCEAEGTVTNSERRVQRVRKAIEPPGDARDDLWILTEIARASARDWREPIAEDVWDEVRSLSPMHRGMSYARLEELGGIQWPCSRRGRSSRRTSTAACGPMIRPSEASRQRSRVVEHELPVDVLDRRVPDPPHDRTPARLATTPACRAGGSRPRCA